MQNHFQASIHHQIIDQKVHMRGSVVATKCDNIAMFNITKRLKFPLKSALLIMVSSWELLDSNSYYLHLYFYLIKYTGVNNQMYFTLSTIKTDLILTKQYGRLLD